jgi:hypothetical protein
MYLWSFTRSHCVRVCSRVSPPPPPLAMPPPLHTLEEEEGALGMSDDAVVFQDPDHPGWCGFAVVLVNSILFAIIVLLGASLLVFGRAAMIPWPVAVVCCLLMWVSGAGLLWLATWVVTAATSAAPVRV